MYCLGSCKAWRKDRIQISVQRIQQRIPSTKRNQSRTDKELPQQGRCFDCGGSTTCHCAWRNTDSNPALSTSIGENFPLFAFFFVVKLLWLLILFCLRFCCYRIRHYLIILAFTKKITRNNNCCANMNNLLVALSCN